jgi:hypothetical protein
MSKTRTEFLDACMRGANAVTPDCYPSTPAEGLAAMMPHFTDVDADTKASGASIFRDAKLRAKLLENR